MRPRDLLSSSLEAASQRPEAYFTLSLVKAGFCEEASSRGMGASVLNVSEVLEVSEVSSESKASLSLARPTVL